MLLEPGRVSNYTVGGQESNTATLHVSDVRVDAIPAVKDGAAATIFCSQLTHFSMSSCPPSLDRAFGPRVDHCRRAFDFTQLFEECIFSIGPSVLLLLAATVRTAVLQRARRLVSDTSMRALKLVVISCFGAVQLTILLLRCLDGAGRTPTTIAAAATSVTDAVAMAILSTREHSRSIRPSWVLEVYLFFTLILDTARTRTAWLIGHDEIYPILTTTGIAIKLAILLLEVREKAGLSPEDVSRSPEERSGAIGQALLWWLVDLVRTGYRKILTLSDLYPLTNEMRSEAVGAKFERNWMQCKSLEMLWKNHGITNVVQLSLSPNTHLCAASGKLCGSVF